MMILTTREINGLLLSSAFVFLFLAFLAGVAIGQDKKLSGDPDDSPCFQEAKERELLMSQAENGQFNVKYVEFWGNTIINSKELFNRIAFNIGEGDIFTKINLENALKSLSRMRKLYPLTTNDVRIRLDREDRDIIVLFCVREKGKK